MNPKKYISSGILELYVLGRLSKRKNAEVANMAKKYPEVADEIFKIQTSLIKLGEKLCPNHSPHELKTKILNPEDSKGKDDGRE